MAGTSTTGYLRGVHEANDRFHLTLFGACGNKYLVQTIELYMRFSLPVRANSMGDRASLQVSHEPAPADDRDAARARDNWVLAQLCVDHLQPSKRRYIEQVGGESPSPQGLTAILECTIMHTACTSTRCACSGKLTADHQSRRISDTPWRGRSVVRSSRPSAISTRFDSIVSSWPAASSRA